MITTIEQAIQYCGNDVRMCGVLKELNIDTYERDGMMYVQYKGVIDIGGANIKFYDKITNMASTFKSRTDALGNLQANILTISTNGDIDRTKYSDDADMVYAIGGAKSFDSIGITYINKAESYEHSGLFGKVVGHVTNTQDNFAEILIINEYHNIIKLPYDYDVVLQKGKTYEMYLNVRVTESERPFIYIQYVEQKEDIAQDVVDQALLEHQIYLSTFENNG